MGAKLSISDELRNILTKKEKTDEEARFFNTLDIRLLSLWFLS